MVRREILIALVIPEHVNQIHRGAVIVRGDHIERVGVPLSWADVVGRAAELAAGVAIAVHKDTGEIRMADRTGRVEVVDADVLAAALCRHTLEAGRR